MYPLRASEPFSRAIDAVADLLGKLRIECVFVSGLARAAWLGDPVTSGAIDVLALMQGQQKNQLAMMAGNRGFHVSREEIEQSEELDLVPLSIGEGSERVRIHVLLASNALYGRMVAAARETAFGERQIRVPAAEDFALLCRMGGDEETVGRLAHAADFDARLYNQRLRSIGLRDFVIQERREGVE